MKKKLHNQPLSFTQEQLQKIDRCLLEVADQVGAPLVMVADISGRLVLYRGRLSEGQSTGLAALAARSFAAGAEIGSFLGLRNQNAFTQQLHEGRLANLYTLAVGEELLLIIAFTKQTMLGLVRVFAQRAQQELLELAEEAEKAREEMVAQGVPDLDAGFGQEVATQLDDLFGELA